MKTSTTIFLILITNIITYLVSDILDEFHKFYIMNENNELIDNNINQVKIKKNRDHIIKLNENDKNFKLLLNDYIKQDEEITNKVENKLNKLLNYININNNTIYNNIINNNDIYNENEDNCPNYFVKSNFFPGKALTINELNLCDEELMVLFPENDKCKQDKTCKKCRTNQMNMFEILYKLYHKDEKLYNNNIEIAEQLINNLDDNDPAKKYKELILIAANFGHLHMVYSWACQTLYGKL